MQPIYQYTEQGYVIPDGYNVETIKDEQARWGIDDIYVPVAHASGVVAWGVPYVDGAPMLHGTRIA